VVNKSLGKTVTVKSNISALEAADPSAALDVVTEEQAASGVVCLDKWYQPDPGTNEVFLEVVFSGSNSNDATKWAVLCPCIRKSATEVVWGDQFQVGGKQSCCRGMDSFYNRPIFFRVIDIAPATTITKIDVTPIKSY